MVRRCVPLLRLPLVTQLRILNRLDLHELVRLSFTSTAAKRLVSVIRTKRADLYLYPMFNVVTILPCVLHKPAIMFNEDASIESDLSWTYNGVLHLPWDGAFHELCARLIEALRFAPSRMWLRGAKGIPLDSPVWRLRTDVFSFGETEPETSAEFIAHLLDTVDTDTLFIRPTMPPQQRDERLKYSRGLRRFRRVLMMSNWLHFDAVLHMDCSFLSTDLEVMVCVERDLNTFIKKWLAEALPNLHRVCLRVGGRMDLDKTLEGVATCQWAERPEVIKFKNNWKDWYEEEDWKIEPDSQSANIRRADGRRATVKVNKFYFEMMVWHDEYLKETK